MEKKELRQKAKMLRRSFKNKEAASAIICERLCALREVKEARILALYCSTEDEVRTDELIERLLKDGKRVGVPLISEKEMVFVEIGSLAECQPGSFGIREPAYSPEKVLCPEEIDVAVFPGLAFDTKKNRLGYGGGYYDRYFAVHPSIVKLALAFECQIFEKLPHGTNDLKVDRIITENRVY